MYDNVFPFNTNVHTFFTYIYLLDLFCYAHTQQPNIVISAPTRPYGRVFPNDVCEKQ